MPLPHSRLRSPTWSTPAQEKSSALAERFVSFPVEALLRSPHSLVAKKPRTSQHQPLHDEPLPPHQHVSMTDSSLSVQLLQGVWLVGTFRHPRSRIFYDDVSGEKAGVYEGVRNDAVMNNGFRPTRRVRVPGGTGGLSSISFE